MFDYFILLSLGFLSQDNHLPRDRRDYKSYYSMIDPTAIVLIQIYVKSERGLSWPADWSDRATPTTRLAQ